MSQERRLILKMLQENRISLEEAETLLDALAGRSSEATSSETVQPPPVSPAGPEQILKHPEQLLKQMGPGIDQLMGSVSSLLGSVTSQLGPAFEKKLDSWRQSSSSSTAPPLTNRSEQQLPLINIQKFICHNPLGAIHVRPAEQPDTLTFSLHKQTLPPHSLAPAIFEALNLRTRQEQGVLELCFEGLEHIRPEQLKADLELFVPSALALELSTSTHTLHCEQLSHPEGVCQLKSQSGDVWLERVALKQIELETASGHIRAEQSSEQLKISSRSGDINLQGSVFQAVLQSQSGYLRMETAVLQALRAETQSGDLDLQLRESPGQIALQSVSGDMSLSGRLQAETTLNSASGDLEAQIHIAPSAAVSLNTNSGDIHLKLDPESQCRLDITSRSGDVESRLELAHAESEANSLKGQLGSGGGSLNIRSNSGDVLIV